LPSIDRKRVPLPGGSKIDISRLTFSIVDHIIYDPENHGLIFVGPVGSKHEAKWAMKVTLDNFASLEGFVKAYAHGVDIKDVKIYTAPSGEGETIH